MASPIPNIHILLALLFLIMTLNTLVLMQYVLRDSSKASAGLARAQGSVGAVTAVQSTSSNTISPQVKLCTVMPYPALNRSTVTASLERWVRVGSPCANQAQTSNSVDLVLYVNKDVTEDDRDLLRASKKILGDYAACFSNIIVLGAELTPEEDEYPAGPSNMFFNVYLDDSVRENFAAYTHMFWMEHDVYPLRPGWVDALLVEASKGDFWMSGSVYLGDGLDAAVQVQYNWNWVGHINGNAVYDLRDNAFVEYLKLVVQYEPPNHFWKPFDVSIWRVLHAFPYTWPFYQKFRGKFIYSDFINHWGFHVTNKDLEYSVSRPEVFLVHGANFSAGNLLVRPKPVPADVIWTDRVTKAMRMSVIIRSFMLDLPFCAEAVKSVIRWVQDALEIVVIVPLSDVKDFQKQLNITGGPPIRVVGEGRVIKDQNLQQKYSKLYADTYCKGDLILHLDSDAVFNQELQVRDILWVNKPILAYQRYETLGAAGVNLPWQPGTSVALGAPVSHEFTRSSMHVYPRTLYPAARKHLMKVHNKNVSTFFQTRVWQHQGNEDASLLFSEFNYLGAYAMKHMAQDFAMAPMDSDERAELVLPPPIIQPPLCHGNARKSHEKKKVNEVVISLRKVRIGGLPCSNVIDIDTVK